MTEKEFAKQCLAHGFSKLAPRFYARCIGDGIYQSIYTGFRQYIHPSAPSYSATNRKSNCINIGIKSLFSHWTEDAFIPGRNCGLYRPEDLLGKNRDKVLFQGIQEEYIQMEESGFSALDSITSQEQLLELYTSTQKSGSGNRVHSTMLVAPYLMTGQPNEAIVELCYHYSLFMHSFQKINRNLLESGKYDLYYTLEKELLDSQNVCICLWDAWLSNREEVFQNYLTGNFQRNMAWVHKYHIPVFGEGFHMRDIPRIQREMRGR